MKLSTFPRIVILAGLVPVVFLGLLCSNPTDTEQASKEPALYLMSDTTVLAGDTLCLWGFGTVGSEPGRCLWSFDNGQTYSDTTHASLLCRSWELADTGVNVVLAMALGSSGEVSGPESLLVTVSYCTPVVSLSSDTVVHAGDSLTVCARADSTCGGIVYYVWSLDSGQTYTDTTVDSCLRLSTGVEDTNGITLVVRGCTRVGACSSPERVGISVLSCRPDIALTGDTVVAAGDTSWYAATAMTPCEGVASLTWTLDGDTVQPDPDSLARFTWDLSDTGYHRIVVQAEGSRGLLSEPCTLQVRVGECRPDIELVADAGALVGDTSRFYVSVASECAAIGSYLWSLDGGESFTDTTQDTVLQKRWSEGDTGMVSVVVVAVSDQKIQSHAESLGVRVSPDTCLPEILIQGDTAVLVGDTSDFVVSVVSACRGVSGYIWSLDGGRSFTDTTQDSVFQWRWGAEDTGIVSVVVTAVSGNGILSEAESLAVAVYPDTCGPELVLQGDTIVSVGDTSLLAVSVVYACRGVKEYYWSLNGGQSSVDTSQDSVFQKVWREEDTGTVSVIVVAESDYGTLSEPESLTVHVLLDTCRPEIQVQGDTVASVGDTSRFAVSVVSACRLAEEYRWSLDGGVSFVDTTRDTVFEVQWGIGDTGAIHVTVVAESPYGLPSAPESLSVNVALNPPRVTLQADTQVCVNDTVVLHAAASDTVRSIDHFLWSIDVEATEYYTTTDELRLAWPVGEAGDHTVRVRAVDTRGISSPLDSVGVRVFLSPPVIQGPSDTLVSTGDTVVVEVYASDSNGTVGKYYWNTGGIDWDDSTDASQKSFCFVGRDTIHLVYGARDDDGVYATDSMTIRYNHPPESLVITSPVDNDTVVFHLFDSSYDAGSVTFTFDAGDRNGDWDSLTYTLSVGTSADSLQQEYQGYANSVEISGLDTAGHYWRLTVTDLYGDSCVATGEFLCLLQKTICFAGHSIVVGNEGTSGLGGFRSQVLQEMRLHEGGERKVKAVGSIASGKLLPASDDSCLAITGLFGMQMSELLAGNPGLSADIWVFMLGVNWTYNATETAHIMSNIESMHSRNSRAEIYAINGLPYPDNFFQSRHDAVAVFNQALADTVTSKQGLGWDLHLVDAFPAFMDSTGRDSTLFFDDYHPTQAGYDTLAVLILNSMGIGVP